MLIPITKAEARPGLTVYGIADGYRFKAIIRVIEDNVIFVRRTEDSRNNSFRYDEDEDDDTDSGDWRCYENGLKRNGTDLTLYGADCQTGILLFEANPEQAAKELENVKSLKPHTQKIKKSDLVPCTTRNIKTGLKVYTHTKSKALGSSTAGTVKKASYGNPLATLTLHKPDERAERAIVIDSETQASWISLDHSKASLLDMVIRDLFASPYEVNIAYNSKLQCFTLQNKIRIYIHKSDLPKPGRCLCAGCGKRGAKYSKGYCETCSYKPF